MKRILSLLALLPLLSGCATLERLDEVKSSAEQLIEDSVQSGAIATAPTDGSLLTKAEAQQIAMDHAKVNRGQISRLRTEYEWDEGRHKYEVEFRQGHWAHQYEIDAQTGEILSWEREQAKG